MFRATTTLVWPPNDHPVLFHGINSVLREMSSNEGLCRAAHPRPAVHFVL